jgi:hypothetical protein
VPRGCSARFTVPRRASGADVVLDVAGVEVDQQAEPVVGDLALL